MRQWIKRALTRTAAVKGPRGRTEHLQSPPDPKLVYGVYFAMIGLAGLIILQIVHLVVLKAWNTDVFAAITGLIGTITGLFIGAKA